MEMMLSRGIRACDEEERWNVLFEGGRMIHIEYAYASLSQDCS